MLLHMVYDKDPFYIFRSLYKYMHIYENDFQKSRLDAWITYFEVKIICKIDLLFGASARTRKWSVDASNEQTETWRVLSSYKWHDNHAN